MRDPLRIPRILAKLSRAWEAAPDLRLGQLIENIALKDKAYRRSDLSCPLFYLEDDVFEDALDKWLLEEPSRYIHPKTS